MGSAESLELQLALERLQVVLEAQSVGLLVEDEGRRVHLANTEFCRLWGVPVPPAALVGSDCAANADAAAPLCREPKAFLARIDAILRANQPVHGEELLLADGRVFERDFVPISLAGVPRGVLWHYRDVTERKRAVEALEAARQQAEEHARLKSNFIAVASHEIRTPLNGVMGMLELLARTDVDAEQRRLLEVALRSSETLLTLLNNVLDFSKLEAGMMVFEKLAWSPRALLDEVCALLGASAGEKNLHLSAAVEPGVPAWLLGDALRTRQILTNLVSNAVKFTVSGGVHLAARCVGEEVLFEVTDTGGGLPDALRPRLFKRFVQGDTSTTRRFGGTGLGLSISHQLAAALGGALELARTGADGTSFVLRLPLRTAEPPLREPASHAAGSFKGLRVLVVDDNAINRHIASAHLRELGCEVVEADDGRQAVELAQGGEFGLVFMDCYMPVVDGFLATQQLRAKPPCAQLTIVAMTASALEEDRRRCFDAGMNDLLAKPARAVDFARVLARWRGLTPQPGRDHPHDTT